LSERTQESTGKTYIARLANEACDDEGDEFQSSNAEPSQDGKLIGGSMLANRSHFKTDLRSG